MIEITMKQNEHLELGQINTLYIDRLTTPGASSGFGKTPNISSVFVFGVAVKA